MKKLIILSSVAVVLTGCVSANDVTHYNNIELVKCSVAGQSPSGFLTDTSGACTQELEKRIQNHQITQQEIDVGNAGGGAATTLSAASRPQLVIMPHVF